MAPVTRRTLLKIQAAEVGVVVHSLVRLAHLARARPDYKAAVAAAVAVFVLPAVHVPLGMVEREVLVAVVSCT
jgi:hypothetical protein